MNDFMNSTVFPNSVRRTLLIMVMLSTIAGAGCATKKERMQGTLRTTFDNMKEAVVNGDLKTLQDIWISHDGRTYSMETLSRYYEQSGNSLINQLQGATVTKAPNVFTPTPEIRKRHPNAKYAGLIRVRNSYGDPRPRRALLVDGEWRLIHSIRLRQSSSNNDS